MFWLLSTAGTWEYTVFTHLGCPGAELLCHSACSSHWLTKDHKHWWESNHFSGHSSADRLLLCHKKFARPSEAVPTYPLHALPKEWISHDHMQGTYVLCAPNPMRLLAGCMSEHCCKQNSLLGKSCTKPVMPSWWIVREIWFSVGYRLT